MLKLVTRVSWAQTLVEAKPTISKLLKLTFYCINRSSYDNLDNPRQFRKKASVTRCIHYR